MHAITISAVCLLLGQTGPGFDFEPQGPAPRKTPFERKGESKAPALKLGEPAISKGKSSEPKTIIQPSSRRPANTAEKEEQDEDEAEVPPSGFKPRGAGQSHRSAAPPIRIESSDEEDESPEPAPRARSARAEPPRTTIHASGNSVTAAGTLLRRALYDTHEKSLPGQPLTLRAALDRTPDRSGQLKVVKAYWLLSVGVAEHHFAVSEADFLAGLTAGRAPHEQAALAAAQAAATAHFRQAELAATATQQDLADLAQVRETGSPPLPADVPYIGNYRTSIKELFANRAAPTALRRIDRTLPHLRELIESQAAAVTAAEKSVHALDQAHGSGDASLSAVLEAFDKLRRQRREFLVAVRDYNFSIADYALAVVAPSASRDMVVATLIETTPKTKSVLVSPRRDVLPASAEEPDDADEAASARLTPADHAPVFRAPINRDLVPVAPPTLRPGDFRPGR